MTTENTGGANRPVSMANLKSVMKEFGLMEDTSERWEDVSWGEMHDFLNKNRTFLDLFIGKKKTIAIAGYGDFDFILVGENESGYIFQCDSIVTTRQMNNTYTSSGGWASMELRTWMNETLLSGFEQDVVDNVKTTEVKYTDSYNSTSALTCYDKLWIPCYQEVFGEPNGNDNNLHVEGEQFEYYACGNSVYKKSFWWLRTVRNSPNFWCVPTQGTVTYGNVYYSYGVVPCFCI